CERREGEWTDHGDDPPADTQVRVDHVVQEALNRVQRVGQTKPRREHPQQDRQEEDADEDVDEVLHGADRVEDQRGRVRVRCAFSYVCCWTPPRWRSWARCSALTSTFRGVSRNTLSATRCIPPSRA